jgi:hypothetical protein
VEQSARRWKKPEGAAQPGEASPVLVATCFLKRRRVENLMEGRSSAIVHRLRARVVAGNLLESISERQGKVMRGWCR